VPPKSYATPNSTFARALGGFASAARSDLALNAAVDVMVEPSVVDFNMVASPVHTDLD
jgi:hypothetical protein